MKYGSEILSIIEAGVENNQKKLKAYCNLLVEKLPEDDYMRIAIQNVLDGSYKEQNTLEAV